MKEKIEFQSVVAETLLIPLYMRAKESRRRDAVLHDPEAERLVARIAYDYGKFDKAWMSALGCVVRSRYYDQRVESFIRLNARPVVVNVGCGLDTRFQRIAERRNAVFYELDLPEVMAIREKLLHYFALCSHRQASDTFSLPLSMSALAEYICADRSAMTREMSRLKKEGILSVQGRKITLHSSHE